MRHNSRKCRGPDLTRASSIFTRPRQRNPDTVAARKLFSAAIELTAAENRLRSESKWDSSYGLEYLRLGRPELQVDSLQHRANAWTGAHRHHSTVRSAPA